MSNLRTPCTAQGPARPTLRRVPSDPIRLRALPSGVALRNEVDAYLASHPMPERESPERASQSAGGHVRQALTQPATSSASGKAGLKVPKNGWASYHVFQAIDRDDLMALSDIRDRDFSLLLQPLPNSRLTPLMYAMNQGPRAQTVVMTLAGFFSKCVNGMDDKAWQDEGARRILLGLRANLHFAIDFAVRHRMTEPVASYVQILVMSERRSWLEDNVNIIAALIAQGRTVDALRAASTEVDKFMVASVHKDILAVTDYRNNAVTDMLMMGCIKALGNVDLVPLSAFGRDERVFNEFKARLKLARTSSPTPRPRVARFCDTVQDIMGRNNEGLAGKVVLLEETCKA